MSVEIKPKARTPAMVSMNYLVMLHICEKILPSIDHPHELLNSTVSEVVSAFDEKYSAYDLIFITDFLSSITGVNGLQYSEISVRELLSTLKDWWDQYTADQQPAPHVKEPILKLIKQLPQRQEDFCSYEEPSHEAFNQLVKVICGESFSSIAYRVMENPFVGFTKATGVKNDFYSITVNLEFITDPNDTYPGCPSPHLECFPMIAISGNPARIGNSLKPAITHAANYLVAENYGAEAKVTGLVVSKNNRVYMTIPVSINGEDCRVCEEERLGKRLLVANHQPEDIYGLDFKKMKVEMSDPLFVDKLCAGLNENDQYYFKAGHFQCDLGI